MLRCKDLLHHGGIKPGNAATREALTCVLRHYAAASACESTIGHVTTVGGIFSRLVVINGLVAASKAHGIWMALLDLLGDKADLSTRIALVIVAVDGLTVECLTDCLDVFLQTLVGEEATRLRGCRRGARRRTGTKGDVTRQIKLLVWQRLGLKEFIVPCSIFSLLSSLLDTASRQLGTSTSQRRTLSARTKISKLLRSGGPHTINALAQGCCLLRCGCALAKLLRAKGGLLGRSSGTLTKLLLAQSGLLFCDSGTLTKLLCTKSGLLRCCSSALTKLLLAQSGLLLCDSSTLAKLLCAKGGLLCRCGSALVEKCISHIGLLRCGVCALVVNLVTKGGCVLPSSRSHVKNLLTESALLLSGGKPLPKALLANIKCLLHRLLLCCPICLRGFEGKPLLLLSSAKRLSITLIENV